MANRALERLRSKDKKGLFKQSQVSITYPTGFIPFDYLNGYKVKVIDKHENILDSYAALGLTGGTFNTIIGKSGTAKSTFAVQVAANMVRHFDDNAFVIYYDLEQALNYTRIKNITQMTQQELEDKFILRQEKNYIEDIFESIMGIANDKDANKDDWTYETGLLDEFGQPIKTYVPTVIIIDSIPTLSSNSTDMEDEMKSDTDVTRMTKRIKQFYTKLMPIIKTYNITIFVINHINAKIEINPFAKTQAQIMYLKQDESVPGGVAPIYYANNLLKFVSSTKYKEEDDGFDGFMIRIEMLKSRSNKAGQFCNIIYNQETGFDPVLTLLQFADDNGLLDGRNPYKYFKNNKDVKFDTRKFREAFRAKEEVRKALTEVTQPFLEKLLYDVSEDNL